jgi:hypothetical protein
VVGQQLARLNFREPGVTVSGERHRQPEPGLYDVFEHDPGIWPNLAEAARSPPLGEAFRLLERSKYLVRVG